MQEAVSAEYVHKGSKHHSEHYPEHKADYYPEHHHEPKLTQVRPNPLAACPSPPHPKLTPLILRFSVYMYTTKCRHRPLYVVAFRNS
jgi:hypothetical protein